MTEKLEVVDGTVEFVPKSYGRRHTGLCVVRSLAIWSLAAIPPVLELAAMILHGKPFNAIAWAAILGVLFVAAPFQWVAAIAWRKPDLRKATWNQKTQILTVSNHRFTRHFFSFGVLEEQIEVAMSDILSVKLVRGRGQHLRIQTQQGFVCLTNDLQPFDELQNLLMSLDKTE